MKKVIRCRKIKQAELVYKYTMQGFTFNDYVEWEDTRGNKYVRLEFIKEDRER